MAIRHGSAAHQLTRRRLLSGILASTGTLALLSACGGTAIATATTVAGTASQSVGSPTITASSGTAAAASAATQSSVATPASSAVPQPAPAAPTRAANAVVFWSNAGYPYKGQIGAQLVSEFEQQGGPTVQYQDTIYKDLMTKLVTTVAAGTPPDLSYVDAYITHSYACSTAVISMSDMIARSKVIKPDMFWPAMMDYGLYKGKVYGIPSGPDVGLLYYNQDAFKSAGLDPEKPPVTWDEALAAVQRLTRTQGSTLQQAGWYPLTWNGPHVWEVPYWQLGGSMFTPDQTAPAFDNANALQALDWLKKLCDAQGGYAALQKFVSAAKGAEAAFVGGQTAMLFDPHATSALSLNGKAHFSWATSYWPVAPGGKQASMIDGWALVIPKGAKQAEGAFRYLEFLNETDPQTRWANAWNNIPAVMAAARLPAFLKANPLNPLTVDLAAVSKTWISALGADDLDKIEQTMVVDVLTGKQTPHDAVSSASASMQATLTEAQKSCAL